MPRTVVSSNEPSQNNPSEDRTTPIQEVEETEKIDAKESVDKKDATSHESDQRESKLEVEGAEKQFHTEVPTPKSKADLSENEERSAKSNEIQK